MTCSVIWIWADHRHQIHQSLHHQIGITADVEPRPDQFRFQPGRVSSADPDESAALPLCFPQSSHQSLQGATPHRCIGFPGEQAWGFDIYSRQIKAGIS